MCLKFVFSIHVFSDSVGESIIDGIPLVNHGGRTFVEKTFNLVSLIFGSCSFGLRTLNVVVAEVGP